MGHIARMQDKSYALLSGIGHWTRCEGVVPHNLTRRNDGPTPVPTEISTGEFTLGRTRLRVSWTNHRHKRPLMLLLTHISE